MMNGSRAAALRRGAAAVALAALTWLAGGCAPKAPPATVPVTPKYPDFVFPAAPAAMGDEQARARHELAWRTLQAGDIREASRQFTDAMARVPAFYPAEAGLGYALVADGKYSAALTHFDRVLRSAPKYASALAGRGEALAAGGQTDLAIESFEAARVADPRLVDLGRRVEVLRFGRVNELVAAAGKAAADGRLDDARRAYERAITASPETAFLYRDLGLVELKAGAVDAALEHLGKASRIDAEDARTWAGLATAHEKSGQLLEAIAALERVMALDPSDAVKASADRLRERIELSRFPPEYRAIPGAAQVTRGDLAALAGLRIVPLLAVSRRNTGVVVTDARGHWAAAWILSVTRAGLMDVFPNHAFQPRSLVRRVELAQVVSRVLSQLPPADVRGGRPAISDVAADHLSYPAASAAVASGLMPLLEGGAFRPTRPVTGAEAVEVIGRLESLVKRARSTKGPRS